MAIFPKIEKVTRDATISHFLLMFGYKLFSLYFPLFLVARGLSLPQVGYTYLLIYLPLALFAPLVGFFNHKLSPAILAVLGISGYAIYSLGMILVPPVQMPFLFYLFQIFLGISGALFFVSMRAILIASRLEDHNRAFAWFYSAPSYATAFAPAVGALFIWKFSFFGVFIFSLTLQLLNAIFCLIRFKKQVPVFATLQTSQGNYQRIFEKLKEKNILILLSVSFSVLFLAGFYRAFFVLFLKDLGWTQNLILFFVSLLSLVFLPFSFLTIKWMEKLKSRQGIFQGAAISGLFSIALGALGAFANFCTIFLIETGRAIGGLMSCSGRSGLLARRLKKQPEEAGAIDTIFSPLGTALGSLFSGLIIGILGFGNLFILGGIFVFAAAIIGKKLSNI